MRTILSERGRSRFALLLVSLGLVVGGLLAAEMGWRALVPASTSEPGEHEFIQRSLELLEPCARIERADGSSHVVAPARPGRAGFHLPLVRDPATLRIAVVGEGSSEELALALERIAARSAESAIEIVDCAVHGAALEHVEKRFDEVLGYQPSLVLVVVGHDLEYRYPSDAARLHARLWMEQSRLLGGLAARYRPLPPLRVDDYEARLARLERFLADAAQRADAAQTSIAFVVLPSNLFFPPPAGADGMDDPAFLEAIWRGVTRGPDAGIAHLEHVREGGEPRPYVEFALGVWQARLGDFAAARTHLQRAIDLQPGSADPYHPAPFTRGRGAAAETIRAVAHRLGKALVDVDSRVALLSAGRLPGWEAMLDHRAVHPYVWDEMAAILALSPEQPAPARGRDYWPATLRNLHFADGLGAPEGPFAPVALAVERWAGLDRRALADTLSSFVDDAEFAATPVERQMQFFVGVSWGYRWAGMRDDSWAWNMRAVALGSAGALVQEGLMAAAERRLEAAYGSFERALELDPQRADAAYFFAKVPAP